MDAISGIFGLIGIVIGLIVLVSFFFACWDIGRIKREAKHHSEVLKTINTNLGTIIHYLQKPK
jgi:hypothetical protein